MASPQKFMAVRGSHSTLVWASPVMHLIIGWTCSAARWQNISRAALRSGTRCFTSIIITLLLCSGVQAQQSGRQTLIVGSEEDYPPFAIGKLDGPADGFTVELWKVVAAEAGLDYTIQVRPFRQILDDFKAGRIDVMI